MRIEVVRNTLLKAQPIQSDTLRSADKLTIGEGSYAILDVMEAPGQHLLVTFTQPVQEQTQWYVFKPHIKVVYEERHPIPKDSPVLQLPDRAVRLHDPVLAGGNFSWAEVTKGGDRVPASLEVVHNIEKMADKLEWLRDFLGGQPVHITSWYRDPEANRRAGGVENSTHIQGYAVDFYVDHLSDAEVQTQLDPIWSGGLGYGKTFTHIDLRSYTVRFPY